MIAVSAAAVGLASVVATTGLADVVRHTRPTGPEPISSVPADNPRLGLVYGGLKPAGRGDPCVGGYRVGEDCTEGPDAPPSGLDVKKPAAPIARAAAEPVLPKRAEPVGPTAANIAAAEGGFTTEGGMALVPDAEAGTLAVSVGPGGVVCEGDGVSGRRVQILYVRETGTTSRFAQYAASFRTWAAGIDTIYDASAAQTGGSRHVRFVTTADCSVDVQEVEIPAGSIATFSGMVSALKTLGYSRTDRKYVIFAESTVYCGIGHFPGDEKTGASNRSNSGPHYARADSGCWSASVAAHELGHNLGAVNNSSPNSSKAGHCLDEYDIMCYNDSGGLKTSVVCTDRAQEQRLDCNHDDYYSTNPSAGSYLATHWNVAENLFLIGAGTATPTPTPGGSVTAAPPASASASPAAPPATPTTTRVAPPSSTPPAPTTAAPPQPSRTSSPAGTPTATATRPPTASPTPTSGDGLKPLRVTRMTSFSVRLSWDEAPGAGTGTRYSVVLNGRAIGQVRATSARIVGLRPNTEYTVSIAIAGTDGTLQPYTSTVTIKTVAVVMPSAGIWLTLHNVIGDGLIGVFGTRSAAGTPVVLRRGDGGTAQQWRLQPTSAGGYLLQSRATGQCVAPAGGVDAPGTPLVQVRCEAAVAAQRWTITTTPYGVALTSPGGLVAGLSATGFGDSQLLALQQPTGAQYQSWATR